MSKPIKILLALIAVGCLGVCLSFLVPYFVEAGENASEMETLADAHRKAREAAMESSAEETIPTQVIVTQVPEESSAPASYESEQSQDTREGTEEPSETPSSEDADQASVSVTETPIPEPTKTPTSTQVRLTPGNSEVETPSPEEAEGAWNEFLITLKPQETHTLPPTDTPIPTPEPTATPVPTATPDRSIRTGALPYYAKEKVELDESKILEELRDLYEINHDLIGWLTIPDTVIDYPVVQPEDEEGMDWYLDYDIYKNKNRNGSIILDCKSDPFTPSYNLVISGHHTSNGQMFSILTKWEKRSVWEQHPIFYFDNLMEHNTYVIFAAFRSAKWEENEEGFRYQANFTTKYEFDEWLKEVRENQIYDTGVDVTFGDECVTLTTCNKTFHREGRFVVVARKLREGETLPWPVTPEE